MTDTVNDAPPSSITPGSVLAWPPNWVNAADDGMRSYSGPDSVLVQTDQLTRCDVSRHATTLVLWFAPTFMVFFMVVCWVMIDDPLARAGMMTLGAFCGIATFGLIYALMKHHHDRGSYIVVDRLHRRVELPRHRRVFRSDDVRCLQLLSGRDEADENINAADLNLLVNEGGQLVRYHLMGNPLPQHARAIAAAIDVPLFVQQVPADWYRSSDQHSQPRRRLWKKS